MSDIPPHEFPEKRVSPWLWAVTGLVLALVLTATAIVVVRLQSPDSGAVDAG